MYKVCPGVRLHFYGLHRNRVFKISVDKLWFWKRFIDNIIGQIQRKIFISFWKILTNSTPTLDLHMKSREKN